MEHGPFEDVFPIENGDIPASYVRNYQRVPHILLGTFYWAQWFQGIPSVRLIVYTWRQAETQKETLVSQASIGPWGELLVWGRISVSKFWESFLPNIYIYTYLEHKLVREN